MDGEHIESARGFEVGDQLATKAIEQRENAGKNQQPLRQHEVHSGKIVVDEVLATDQSRRRPGRPWEELPVVLGQRPQHTECKLKGANAGAFLTNFS